MVLLSLRFELQRRSTEDPITQKGICLPEMFVHNYLIIQPLVPTTVNVWALGKNTKMCNKHILLVCKIVISLICVVFLCKNYTKCLTWNLLFRAIIYLTEMKLKWIKHQTLTASIGIKVACSRKVLLIICPCFIDTILIISGCADHYKSSFDILKVCSFQEKKRHDKLS